LTIRVDEVELAILDGLKELLMEPALFEEFAREFKSDSDGGGQSKQQIREEVVRKAGHVLKGAVSAV
jgi:hypothetical protein